MTWKSISKMVWIVGGHLIHYKLLPLPIKYSVRWRAFSHTCTLRNKTVRLLFPPVWQAQSAGQLRQQRRLISHTFLNVCKQNSWNISHQPVQRMSADGGPLLCRLQPLRGSNREVWFLWNIEYIENWPFLSLIPSCGDTPATRDRTG